MNEGYSMIYELSEPSLNFRKETNHVSKAKKGRGNKWHQKSK